MPVNITLPEGTTNHGNPNLLCTPARWYDVLLFFVTNYFAHAATVVPRPGQGFDGGLMATVYAIVLPSTALVRAVLVIARRASFETKNPLKRAARAGALCMVLKRPAEEVQSPENADVSERRWRLRMESEIRNSRDISLADLERGDTDEPLQSRYPSPNEQLEGGGTLPRDAVDSPVKAEPSSSSQDQSDSHWWDPRVQPRAIPLPSQIHGEYWLHTDYYLAPIPPSASLRLVLDPPPQHPLGSKRQFEIGEATLASSQNALKLCISLAQAIWAIITIYRSRGDQIGQYGYAAFGLTVVPYAVMSIVNTVANLTTPNYPCLFVIRTPAMSRAEAENKAVFKEAISVELEDSTTAEEASKYSITRLLDDSVEVYVQTNNEGWLVTVIAFVLSLAPLAIVGGISGFHKGNSSRIERGFTMSWLVVGIIGGFIFKEDVARIPTARAATSRMGPRIGSIIFDFLFLAAVFGVPAIGGMVMVGRMIREYGVCTLID